MAQSKHKSSCSNGCKHCAIGVIEPDPAALSGWRLGASTAVMFLAPLATATIGAIAGGGSGVSQFIGAVVGLAGGMIAAIALVRLLHRFRGEVQ